jgi:uncharacterized protein YraI
VFGVEPDDTLVVRTGPGTNHRAVAELSHDAKGIRIEKRCKSMWCRIKVGDVDGYVNTHFLEFEYATLN